MQEQKPSVSVNTTNRLSPKRNQNLHLLRERLNAQQNFDGFNDAEILSTLLSYSDSIVDPEQTAENLIDCFGSLKAVLEARPEQLNQVKDLNQKAKRLIGSFIPLSRAWIQSTRETQALIRNKTDVINYCRSLLIGERLEKLYVIALNAQGRVIGKRCISTGSLSEVNAYPRVIFETALNYNACSIVLCHNHPGGKQSPSINDITQTKSLLEHIRYLGISLVDHIIVAGNNAYSMREHGDVVFGCDWEEQREDIPRSTSSSDISSTIPDTRKLIFGKQFNKKVAGKIINSLRNSRGLSLEQLALLSGLNPDHLAAVENGERSMKLGTLWNLSLCLGFLPHELIQLIDAVSAQKDSSRATKAG